MTEKKRPDEGQKGFGIGDIFKGIGNFIDLLAEMVEEGKTEVKRTGELRGTGKMRDLKGIYGFNIKIGLGGEPTVETFGNIKETKEGPVVEEVREPIVDIFDEGVTFRIIAELPGVDENEIKVDMKDDILVITAEGKQRKYSKEALLPSRVKPDSLTTSYKNGILEIIITKM